MSLSTLAVDMVCCAMENAGTLPRVLQILQSEGVTDVEWLDDRLWLGARGLGEVGEGDVPTSLQYQSAVSSLVAGAPEATHGGAVHVVDQTIHGVASPDMPHVWHLVSVGTPPSSFASMNDTYRFVRLPGDICFVSHSSYQQQSLWWLSSLGAVKIAYDCPTGHVQLNCYGPVCLQLIDYMLACNAQAVNTWSPQERVRDGAYQAALAAAALEDDEACCLEEAQED